MFLSDAERAITLCLISLCLWTCQSGAAPEKSDIEVADLGLADATADADIGTADADSQGSDGAADAALDVEKLQFDASIWSKANSCEGEVVFPDDNREFQVPDRPPESDPVIQRRDFIHQYGGLPLQGFGILPAADLEPGGGMPFQLFSEPGNDARFHLYVINRYEDEELTSFRINATVMVDYEPVEVSYTRMSPDREQRQFLKVAHGVSFQAESDFEIIDIRIRGELFDEPRMYEIGINLQTTTLQRSPNGLASRFALFSGGYSRPSRPCAEPRLNDEPTDIESQAPGRIHDGMALLFFDGITHRDELREEIEVAPGDTVNLYLSVFRVRDEVFGPTPTVLQPVMNGEPFGEQWWVTQGGERENYWDVVDARKSFEVTFPEEPGIYEVQVLSWEDPYEIAKDIDGERIEGVSDGGRILENSNALRFRVTESE